MNFDPLGTYWMEETGTISPSPVMAFEEAFARPEAYARIQREESHKLAIKMGLIPDDSSEEDCE